MTRVQCAMFPPITRPVHSALPMEGIARCVKRRRDRLLLNVKDSPYCCTLGGLRLYGAKTRQPAQVALIRDPERRAMMQWNLRAISWRTQRYQHDETFTTHGSSKARDKATSDIVIKTDAVYESDWGPRFEYKFRVR